MDVCRQLWLDGDGLLCCTLYINGQNIEVEAHSDDFGRPLGFYDEADQPIPDPIERWAAEAAASK